MTRPTPPVTPTGVRDGDPDSLAGLAQRRSGSVLDYARHACGETAAMDATAETFARFRAAVVAADDPHDLAPDPLLLSCTRNAAAALSPASGSRPECPATAFLIIGRYEGTNSPADEARLTKHLATCNACTDRAAAFDRAERAFRAPHPPAPEGAVVARVIAALVSAAPVLGGAAAATAARPPSVVPAIAEPPAGPAAAAPAVTPGPDDTYDTEALTGEIAATATRAADTPLPATPLPPDLLRRVVVPATILGAGVLVAMGIAGVFGGTDPEPARGATGIPAPTPPARPPAADEDVQQRAARAARAALRRIEAHERITTRQAQAQRAAEAAGVQPADPLDEVGASSSGGSGSAATPRTGNGTGTGTGTTKPSSGSGGDPGIETIEPGSADSGTTDPDSPVFEPGATPTPG